MKSKTWISQYKRVMRWKEYIVQLSSKESEFEFQRMHDYFFSFINNCNHLGDWLEKCGYEGANDYRNDNPNLDICRALSNGDKHFIIDKYKNSYIHKAYRTHLKHLDSITSTSTTGFSDSYQQENEMIPIKPSYPLNDGDIIIQAGTEIYNAFDFIDQCIDAWHCYFKRERIDY